MGSIIYNVGGSDNTLILGSKDVFLQQFKTLNWTDLRLSMMLSLTKQSDPNDPTGLAESLGAGEDANQVYIGFKSADSLLPPSTNFWGTSTRNTAHAGDSTELAGGGGAEWTYGCLSTVTQCLYASNGTTKQNNVPGLGTSPYFQDGSGIIPGYATFISLRMLRNDPTSNLVDLLECAEVAGVIGLGPSGLQTDTSIANIRALTAAADFASVMGPFSFTSVPNAIFAYWPFVNSRLRIHSYVLEKYA